MGKSKLTNNMQIKDIFITMCEGNPGALQVLMQMMEDPTGIVDIYICDSLGIRGSKLYMLNNDCCGRNFEKFKRTLMMIACGVFSEEEIHNNLDLVRAIPFIDDSIVIEGVPSYGEFFDPFNEKWLEYCDKNREAFIQKLNAILGKSEDSFNI